MRRFKTGENASIISFVAKVITIYGITAALSEGLQDIQNSETFDRSIGSKAFSFADATDLKDNLTGAGKDASIPFQDASDVMDALIADPEGLKSGEAIAAFKESIDRYNFFFTGPKENFDILFYFMNKVKPFAALSAAAAGTPFTLFAPDDAAWLKTCIDLGIANEGASENEVAAAFEKELERKGGQLHEVLTRLLNFHYVPQLLTKLDLLNSKHIFTFVDGKTIMRGQTGVDENELTDYAPDLLNPRIVQNDILTLKGVIHIIDRVLLVSPFSKTGKQPSTPFNILPSIPSTPEKLSNIEDFNTWAGTKERGFDDGRADFDIVFYLFKRFNPEVLEEISRGDPFTLFAPNDEAFIRTARELGLVGKDAGEAEAASKIELALAKKGDLKKMMQTILDFHMATEKLTSSALMRETEIYTFADGLSIKRGQKGVDRLELTDYAPSVSNPKIVRTDIFAFEGVIHIIDAVLLPLPYGRKTPDPAPAVPEEVVPPVILPKRLSTLEALKSWAGASGGFDEISSDFDILLYLLKRYNPEVLEEISRGDPFTLFAPNDEAFLRSARDLGLVDQNGDEEEAAAKLEEALAKKGNLRVLMKTLLNYHFAVTKLAFSELLHETKISTFADELTIRRGQSGADRLELSDISPALLNPKIVITDAQFAFEGVIHVIDRVLWPVSFNIIPRPPSAKRPSSQKTSTISDLTSWAGGTGGFEDDLTTWAGGAKWLDREKNDFDILMYLLGLYHPRLLKILSGGESFTLFAPNDEAFILTLCDLGIVGNDVDEAEAVRKIEETMAKKGDLKTMIQKLLDYHVAPEMLTSAKLLRKSKIYTFARELTIKRGQVESNRLELVDYSPNTRNPKLVKTDILTFEGVIHTLDRVLLPFPLGRSRTTRRMPATTLKPLPAGKKRNNTTHGNALFKKLSHGKILGLTKKRGSWNGRKVVRHRKRGFVWGHRKRYLGKAGMRANNNFRIPRKAIWAHAKREFRGKHGLRRGSKRGMKSLWHEMFRSKRGRNGALRSKKAYGRKTQKLGAKKAFGHRVKRSFGFRSKIGTKEARNIGTTKNAKRGGNFVSKKAAMHGVKSSFGRTTGLRRGKKALMNHGIRGKRCKKRAFLRSKKAMRHKRGRTFGSKKPAWGGFKRSFGGTKLGKKSIIRSKIGKQVKGRPNRGFGVTQKKTLGRRRSKKALRQKRGGIFGAKKAAWGGFKRSFGSKRGRKTISRPNRGFKAQKKARAMWRSKKALRHKRGGKRGLNRRSKNVLRRKRVGSRGAKKALWGRKRSFGKKRRSKH